MCFRCCLAKLLLCALLLALAACDDPAGQVHDGVPRQIDTAATYVFVLPDGAEPDTARAEALAGVGFEAVLARRKPGKAFDFAAVDVKEDLRLMLARGVPLGNLAVLGAGAGGRLALAVAAIMKAPEMHVVVLNACAEGRIPDEPVLAEGVPLLRGHVLSLAAPGKSCQAVLDAAPGADSWEVELSGTGDSAWLAETRRWIVGD